MSQTWNTFVSGSGGTTFGGFFDKLQDNLDAIKSAFTGTTAPSSPVVGQIWVKVDGSGVIQDVYVYSGNTSLGTAGWVQWSYYDTRADGIYDEVVDARGSASDLDTRLSVALNDDGTLKDTTTASYFATESGTVAYASASTFTIAGVDRTAIYAAGRAIRLDQTSDAYGYVSSSSFSTDTTVTVVGCTVDTGLSSVQYGPTVVSVPAHISPYVDSDINSNKEFQDSKELRFGSDNDARIYHDGSNFYALNGTGNTVFTIPSGASLQVNPNGGTESGFSVTSNGAVTLYYDNAVKLATTSTGVSVTGNANFSDSGVLYLGTDNDASIYHDGSHLYLTNTTGNINIRPKSGEAGIVILPDSTVSLYHDNVQVLETHANGVKLSQVGDYIDMNFGGYIRYGAPSNLADGQFYASTVYQLQNVTGSTITPGMLLRNNVLSQDSVALADADDASTMPAIFMSLSTFANGAYGLVTPGPAILCSSGWSWTDANSVPLYVSTTAGYFTETAPSGAGDQVQCVGQALHPTVVLFMPSLTMVEVA